MAKDLRKEIKPDESVTDDEIKRACKAYVRLINSLKSRIEQVQERSLMVADLKRKLPWGEWETVDILGKACDEYVRDVLERLKSRIDGVQERSLMVADLKKKLPRGKSVPDDVLEKACDEYSKSRIDEVQERSLMVADLRSKLPRNESVSDDVLEKTCEHFVDNVFKAFKNTGTRDELHVALMALWRFRGYSTKEDIGKFIQEVRVTKSLDVSIGDIHFAAIESNKRICDNYEGDTIAETKKESEKRRQTTGNLEGKSADDAEVCTLPGGPENTTQEAAWMSRTQSCPSIRYPTTQFL